jgi:hypothetical protein
MISTRNRVQIEIANAMKKVANSTPGTQERRVAISNADPEGSDLRNIGVSTGDFDADVETNDEIEDMDELDDFGDMDVAGPVGGQASTAAGSVEGAGEVGPVS